MRFSWKMFIYTYILIVISFSLGGFLIIEAAFQNNIRSRETALRENNAYIASTYLTMRSLDEKLGTSMAVSYCNSVYQETKESKVFVGGIGNVEEYNAGFFKNQMESGCRLVRMIGTEGNRRLQIVSKDDRMGNYSCVETVESVEDVFQARDENYRQFQLILLAVSLVSAVMLLLLARHLTKPLKKLADTAREIGAGDFGIRAKESRSSEEVRILTEEFNKMAGYVQRYIEELQDENRRREEFVGNFTHELKTPLTSVIGYADLLRSYELDSEKRRQFADYIYKEGSRMEALALHLLNLQVLRKEEFELKEIRMSYFFHDTKEQLHFLLEKYECEIEIDFEEAVVFGEEDLLKTLLYNLVDNGCKAMSGENEGRPKKIKIMGTKGEETYKINVRDFGCGIAPEEIRKITEAFYMVDKSRARTMGGAGLGLALCKQIARIHRSNLEIESEPGVGSCFGFSLMYAEEAKHE